MGEIVTFCCVAETVRIARSIKRICNKPVSVVSAEEQSGVVHLTLTIEDRKPSFDEYTCFKRKLRRRTWNNQSKSIARLEVFVHNKGVYTIEITRWP
jgi:hypothetical protein